jgi:ectoine hydroxylase-related dioxygenase (phytanoyl-CoA dioxygenase family)
VGFDAEAHEARLRRDGYTIVEDFLDAAQLAAAREALAPFLGAHLGRNAFEGLETERVYTLVARGRVFEDATEDPRLLVLLERFLQPGFLLTASQAIAIQPGERAQPIHYDDAFYRQARPRPAISLSLICGLDAFTADNGATELVPGSHAWSSAEVAELVGADGIGGAPPAEIEARLVPAMMPAGAALVFQGTLLHRGGANRTGAARVAFTSQYCEPWARTQENFFLAIPRDRVARMSPRLQSLLGYDIWPPFMGHVTASHPTKSLDPAWVPPVVAQRRCREGA